MKTKLTLAILALVCFVCVSAVPQSKPTQWEYKFEVKCNEKKANTLGAEGWEMTGYSQWSVAMSAVDTCVFKRAK